MQVSYDHGSEQFDEYITRKNTWKFLTLVTLHRACHAVLLSSYTRIYAVFVVLCTMSGCPMSRVAEAAGVVMVIAFLAKATKAFSTGSPPPSSVPRSTSAEAVGGKAGTSIPRGSNRLPTELWVWSWRAKGTRGCDVLYVCVRRDRLGEDVELGSWSLLNRYPGNCIDRKATAVLYCRKTGLIPNKHDSIVQSDYLLYYGFWFTYVDAVDMYDWMGACHETVATSTVSTSAVLYLYVAFVGKNCMSLLTDGVGRLAQAARRFQTLNVKHSTRYCAKRLIGEYSYRHSSCTHR